MTIEISNKRKKIMDPIDARLAFLELCENRVDPENYHDCASLWEAISQQIAGTGRRVASLFKNAPVPYDKGRVIACIDRLNEAAEIARQAVFLPSLLEDQEELENEKNENDAIKDI